jgi:threonyl-tRNA synthetase
MLEPNDHRHIAQRLGLFHMQEEAPGMAFWHPRGSTLYRVMEGAIRRHMEGEGFAEVRTPQILRQAIWEASGHWEHFQEHMFVLEEERTAALKPVSCPAHFQIARRMSLSYRDMPLRLGELGLVHRNERSGSLHGLFRLRQFTQDDGHIFCPIEQVAAEVERFCRGLRKFYAAFDFDGFDVGFSTRPDKRAGSDAAWDRAEAVLAEAGTRAGLDLREQPGEGAFYGPKLEFVLRDHFGRAWQCGTIQLDLVLAGRFDVSYVDRDGLSQRPAILHRAVLGSLERFLGIVLEHVDGALPGWLAPEQVVVLPVAEAQHGYADEMTGALLRAGLRSETDARAESLGKRIRAAHDRGVPFAMILGSREAGSGRVTVRARNQASFELDSSDGIERLVALCAAPW